MEQGMVNLMKTIGLNQPYFFPYLGYFSIIKNTDKWIILDVVQYIKKGWINRNRTLLNKKDYMFTIALKSASQNKLINQIEICEKNGKILKTIKHG